MRTWDGRRLGYDLLLVAVGARSSVSIPGSVTVRGPRYTSRFRTVLRELDERHIRRVAFAVPPGTSWPLPLYELALMTSARVAERGLRQVELSLVTPESEPLELFGPAASARSASCSPSAAWPCTPGAIPVSWKTASSASSPPAACPPSAWSASRGYVGPGSRGFPGSAQGFIPVDLHGKVPGEPDVYAAGDATTCPIKQGGVATQQADAAAESIAARAGADVDPQEFRPVLRGLLLTGSTPRYMRAEVSGGRGGEWDVSEHALWWPPGKIAGRRLAPYLALRHEELEETPNGLPVEVRLDTPSLKRRAIIAPGADFKVAR